MVIVCTGNAHQRRIGEIFVELITSSVGVLALPGHAEKWFEREIIALELLKRSRLDRLYLLIKIDKGARND